MTSLLLLSVAFSGAPKYRECSVAGGVVVACGSPFSGEVVRGEDGGDEAFLQRCEASGGSIVSCSGLFTGVVPLLQPDRKYHSCSVKDGKVSWCDPKGYEGSAILRV